MKKIFMFLVAFATIVFVSCTDDDNDTDDPNNPGKYFQSGTIKIISKYNFNELYVYSYHEGETIDIEWGDGRSSSYITVCANDEDWGTIYETGQIKHDYSSYDDGLYMSAIKGNIQMLICNDNVKLIDASQCPGLKVLWVDDNASCDSLIVSGCIALRELECEGRKYEYGRYSLTMLNLKDCSALSYLNCSYNELTSLSLPKNSILKHIDVRSNELDDSALNTIYSSLPTDTEGIIYISGNPGEGNRSIAEQKGWKVSDAY